MVAYNLTRFASNSTDILSITTKINVESGFILGNFLLFGVFIFFFMVFKQEDSLQEWIISSFLTSIIGGLMFFIGLIAWTSLIIPIMILIITVIIQMTRG